MRITVKAFANLRSILGGSHKILLELREGSSLKDLINTLSEKYGKLFKESILQPEKDEIHPYIKILLNGRDVEFLNGLLTKLNDGDEVVIIPPAGGGDKNLM